MRALGVADGVLRILARDRLEPVEEVVVGRRNFSPPCASASSVISDGSRSARSSGLEASSGPSWPGATLGSGSLGVTFTAPRVHQSQSPFSPMNFTPIWNLLLTWTSVPPQS